MAFLQSLLTLYPTNVLNTIVSHVLGASLFIKAGTFVTALILWVVIHRWNERKFTKGPTSWPIIGAAITHASNLEHFHDYITEYCRKYKTFRVAYPGFDYYYTADPANVEYMLKTNFDNYVKGKFAYEKQRELFGDGIFSVDGMEWKRQRRVASYEFASKALKELSELTFRDYATKLASLILLEAREHKPVDMQDVVMRLTFDSICKVGFGLEMGSLLQNPSPTQRAFSKAFDNSNAMVFFRYIDPLWKLKRWLGVGNELQYAKDISTLDNFVFSFIEERRGDLQKSKEAGKEAVKSDLLSRYLSLNEAEPEEYTNQKIRDIIVNFMIAGRDTTALTLCWFFYSLCNNPCVEEKLMQEIFYIESQGPAAVAADDSGDGGLPSGEQIKKFAQLLTYEKLSEMHYLQACLQETLRLYPAVPIDFKIAATPDTLPDGTKVRKGDSLNYSAYAMGRMEWLWGEDASEFKPERFLRNGVCQQESPFKLPAFMAGPRMCLGKDFAYLQMKVTAAILLRFFKFEIVPGHKVHYRMMLTLHMSKQGLKVNVLSRSRKPFKAEQMDSTLTV